MDTSRIAVMKVVEVFGSRRALAEALGISAVAVGQWLKEGPRGRGVPPKQCVRIERLMCASVTRRDLRPDDWQDIWPELADPSPTHTQAAQAEPQEVA